MAKELLKDTATAAADRLLQSLMPTLNARLDAIQQQIADFKKEVDRRFEKIDEKFERVDEKFERQTELINELGLRIHGVGSKVDTDIDISKITFTDIHKFLERVVRVEEAQKRSRKAS